MSFNVKEYKFFKNDNFNSYRKLKIDKIKFDYNKTKTRIPHNFRILKLQIKEQVSQDKDNKNLLNEKNKYARHSHLKFKFKEKFKINRLDLVEKNKLQFGKDLNLTSRVEKNLYDNFESNQKNKKMKYFLTKKDLFFENIK